MILREFKVDDANIWFVRFEHDPYCQRLVCGNQRGRVFLFNIFESDEIGVTRSQELTHLKCNSTIRHAFSPNRKCIVTYCDDGTIWRYDVAKVVKKKKINRETEITKAIQRKAMDTSWESDICIPQDVLRKYFPPTRQIKSLFYIQLKAVPKYVYTLIPNIFHILLILV